MADFTQHTSSSSTSSSSSMDDMDMSTTSTSTSSMSTMYFHTSTTDSLFTTQFTPTTTGQYAGAVIFLIVLAFIYRFLFAWRAVLEHGWSERNKVLKALIGVAGDGEKDSDFGEVKVGAGVGVVVVKGKGWGERPWRLSTDVPRAGLGTVIAGVGYLLMLAVMTYNVGYFLAVLGGLFLGEIVWGRWTTGYH
ncbi:hypothetical protein RUND412_009659 [Rhizina undulata]